MIHPEDNHTQRRLIKQDDNLLSQGFLLRYRLSLVRHNIKARHAERRFWIISRSWSEPKPLRRSTKMYPWIHSVLQSNAVNATLVPSTGGMKRQSAQTYGLDIQVICGSSKIYLGAGKTATIEIADPVADRAVWT
jgi:hypothetical protein